MGLREQLEHTLEARRKRALLRSLTVAPPNSVDFSSNDFLGSRLLDGNSVFAETLEKYIAQFHKGESALIFSSGFDANVGFFSCVPQPGDAIILDEFVHASVHDGVRNSRAKTALSFLHNNVEDLVKQLEKVVKNIGREKNIFIAVESLYSMDGDIAPLREIVDALKPFNAYLVVDEAHATGVFGEQGRGIVCELGLENQIFARLHTFGKALATNGAAILGPQYLRTYLINYARPLIFSTFLPYSSLISIKCAYKIISSPVGDQLRNNLKKLIQFFRSSLKLPSYMLLPSTSAIQGIILSGNESVVNLSCLIQRAGFNVKPIRSPTVPKGKERVRICIHADNTELQILKLAKIIEDYVLPLIQIGSKL
ncbi:hypothetical protein G9A89_011914 [Geosiphon pyriformis]|nr:hypothetical protein G9A89_011914 [Geosiphon pyriformis]